MLNLKRLDILLGYPSEHHYLAKSMYFEENLTQRAIVEAPPLSYGYIGCTKNEQGAKNIQLLDEQLKKIKQTVPFLTECEKILDMTTGSPKLHYTPQDLKNTPKIQAR